MTAVDRVPDSVLLAGRILVISVALLGLQVQTARYAYGSVPIPYTVVLAPLLGIVVYFWTTSTSETITALLGAAFLTGVGTVAVLATPMFVQELAVPQENVILMGAVQEAIGYTALGGALLAAGAVVGTVARHSIDLELDRGRSVVIAVVCLLVGALLAGSIVVNLSSSVDQSDVEAEVESIESVEETIEIRIGVENRLTDELRINSGNLQLSDGGTPVSVSGFPGETISSGDRGTVTLQTSCADLEDGGLGDADDIRITGLLYAESFNAYEFRISVAETTVEDPC